MYLTVDLTIVQLTFNTKSLIRKVNTKSCGYDKIYMDKDLIEDLLYQMVDQSNERKLMIEITALLNNIHPFYDGSGRTCKILLVY